MSALHLLHLVWSPRQCVCTTNLRGAGRKARKYSVGLQGFHDRDWLVLWLQWALTTGRHSVALRQSLRRQASP